MVADQNKRVGRSPKRVISRNKKTGIDKTVTEQIYKYTIVTESISDMCGVWTHAISFQPRPLILTKVAQALVLCRILCR